MPEAKS